MSVFPSYVTIITVLCIAGSMLATLYLLVRFVSKLMISLMEKRIEKALLRRRAVNDNFRDENGFSWDFVIAFPVFKGNSKTTVDQRVFSTKFILSKLSEGGLEFRLFYNIRHDVVYCKLRASTERLMLEADRINMKLAYDEKQLEQLCKSGRSGLWSGLNIPESCIESKLPPYRFIFGPFQFDSETRDIPTHLQEVYKKWRSCRLVQRESFSTPSPLLTDSKPVQSPSSSDNRSASAAGNKPAPQKNKYLLSKAAAQSVDDGQELEGFVKIEDQLIFRSSDRLKLIDSILNNKTSGGCCLDVDELLKLKCIVGFLPLHDDVAIIQLQAGWIQILQFPWNQSVDAVKDYFGERIGLFFVFLGHQTSWLIAAAVVGFGCWINIAVMENDPNAIIMPYFAAFISLWTTFHLDSFERLEVKTAQKWGMVGFEDQEAERPQFIGSEIKSPVTGKKVLYFSKKERFRRSLRSYATILCSLTISVGVLALLLFIRVIIGISNAPRGVSDVLTSILISIQIEVLNSHYISWAIKLNDNENYRTETEYEDALIAKTFIFQFINSLGCLFYIAFMQPFVTALDPCLSGNCYSELQTTLGSIFMTRLVLCNAVKVVKPMIHLFLQTKEALHNQEADAAQGANGIGIGSEYSPESAAAHKLEMSEVEKSFQLVEFDPLLGTFQDYAHMATQYEFMTMFAAAFPLTTFLALVNNYVELRVNAWRLCQVCRRPKPRGAEDIGTWFVVFEIISTAAVLTNAGIVCFTGTYLIKCSWALRVWIFIAMSAITLMLKIIIRAATPAVSSTVEIQLKRMEYINRKLLYNVADSDLDVIPSGGREKPSWVIAMKDK